MRWYASLRRPADFARVRRRGRRGAFETLSAFALERRGGAWRVGITVAGTVGGAVVRNLIRRRVQGALDALPPERRQEARARDLVLVLRPCAAQAPYSALERDVAAAVAAVPGKPA